MWENFKGMPTILKFLSAQGIFFLIAGALSILPFGGRAVGGREVSYSEWWASGNGFLFLLASISIGIGAVFLLKKIKYARVVYFFTLAAVYSLVFILNPESLSNLESFVAPALLLSAIYWYLFHKQSVSRYFSADNL